MRSLAFLVGIALVGCTSQPNQAQSKTNLQNPYSVAGFQKTVPHKIFIEGPMPIFHPESDAVLQPRLRQLKEVVAMTLEKKGYAVERNYTPGLPRVVYDYSTQPDTIRDGQWEHRVELTFKGVYPTERLGATAAVWRSYPSESIDTILMSLGILACDKIPPPSE